MTELLSTPEAGPRVIRGGALRVVGYAAGVAIALGSSAFLFRYLGPVDSGRYVAVLTLALMCAGLTDLGATMISMREYAIRPADERDVILRNLMTIRLALTAVGMGVACVYAALAGFGATLVAGTAIAAAGLLVLQLQTALTTVLVTDLRLGWVTAAEVLRQVVGGVCVVAMVAAGAELIGFFAAAVAGTAVALGVTLAAVGRPGLLRPAWSLPVLRSLAREALPFAAASTAGALYVRIGVPMVAQLTDPLQTGYFATSFRVIEALVAVPALAVSTAFPVFARAGRDDAVRLAYAVQRTFDASLLAGAGIAVILALGSPVAIEIIGGEEKFGAAAAVLRLHAIAVCFAFVSAVLMYGLLSLRAYRAILLVTLCGLVVLLAATVIATEADGARGAAIAAGVGELTLVVAGFVALARTRSGVRLSLRAAPRVAVAAAVAITPAPFLPALPAAAVSTILFAAAAAATGAVPDELWDHAARPRPFMGSRSLRAPSLSIAPSTSAPHWQQTRRM